MSTWTVGWGGANSSSTWNSYGTSAATTVTWNYRDPDEGGTAGVREPRRPLPAAPAAAVALEVPNGPA